MGVGMSSFDYLNPDQFEFDSNDEESIPRKDCPVKDQAKIALKSGKETKRALRSLRESLLRCDICPQYPQCEFQEEFNLQIDLVIADINEEWGW